ncbi:hypothetical protein RRG08_002545 [Elysia crispata]|uniref:DDE-1 domain-containing protein n=1 Tax=Elysia crispata TaxID=231223 RepID=A0AAE1CT40_9GAST|nr:hypothetical protein RRG08_002545 [Elysia crispata]
MIPKQTGSWPRKERDLLTLLSPPRKELLSLSYAPPTTCVPPMLIFPRKNYKDHFLFGAPPGSYGITNDSGWIKEDNFLTYVEHFAAFAKPTEQKHVLLIMDNHISHLK